MKKIIKYKAKIVNGNKVKIITGKEKGKIGEIVCVNLKKNKIKIKGMNIVKRHYRKNQNDVSRNNKSRIVVKEAFIHISNVELIKSS